MPASESTLELRLLGDMALYRDGAALRLPQSKKTRALLSYLVLTGRPQRRSRLCMLLWDVADDPRAALRWSLSKLRPLVNDATHTRIVTEGDTVALECRGMSIDLATAQAALGRGVASIATDELIAIDATFRGELLEGLAMSDFDDFQAWLLAQREDVRRLRVDLLRSLVDRLAAEPERALPFARTLVELEPVDEQVRARLVELLVAANRLEEARNQRELSERQLRELGVAPTGAIGAPLQTTTGSEPGASVRSQSPPAPITAARIVEQSPLVGRHAEQKRLDDVLAGVVSTSAEGIALITGEPGVGKTRLLTALLDRARAHGGDVLEGRAFEAERGRPFGPWIDALRHGPAVRLSEGTATHLAPLIGEGAAPSQESTRSQMFRAVAELVITQTAASGLLVLAIDDVQWIDEASAELLHYLVRSLVGQPILVALTARAGEIVDNEPLQRVLRSWRRERRVHELEVGPLGRADTETLVAATSSDADPGWVFEQCRGNALFALELARSGARAEGELAPTLAEVVRGRVERLSAEAIDVLRWLSVFGLSARIDQLEQLIDLPIDQLIAALTLVERHALVSAEGDSYRFAHDLVRHVVYGELSEPRRRLMHRQVAQRLLAGAGENAAEVAYHANLAGDAVMAARACVAAARRSLKLLASRDVLALARRGVRYLSALAEPERTTVAIDLWDVRLSAESPDDVESVAEELERLAERATDAGCLEHARLGFHLLAYLRWEGGRSRDAIRHMLHAEQLTRGADGPHRAVALAEAARCLIRLDVDLGHAQALVLEAGAAATRAGVKPPGVPAAVGMLRCIEGAVDEALISLREAQQRARRQQDGLNEFFALEWIVMSLLHAQRWDDAVVECRRLVSLGDRLRDGSEGPCARAFAAVAELGCATAGAAQRLDAALEELREVDAKHRLGYVLLTAATIEVAQGDCVAARAHAEEGLEMATAVSHRSDIAWAHTICARTASACGDDAAEARHLRALRETRHEVLAVYARDAVRNVLQIS